VNVNRGSEVDSVFREVQLHKTDACNYSE